MQKMYSSLPLAIPSATFVGRCAGEERAKPVTQIFKSLKTEALNQDFFGFPSLRLQLCKRKYFEGKAYTEGWSESQNRNLEKFSLS